MDEATFFDKETGELWSPTPENEPTSSKMPASTEHNEHKDSLEGVSFVAIVTSLSSEFDELTATRHAKGADKYGPAKFLTVDTIEEALQELADLANYIRYTYINLRLLQEGLMTWQNEQQIRTTDSTPIGFIKAKDYMTPKGDNK